MSSTTEREKEAPRPVRRPGDRIFEGLSTSAGILILLTLLGVAIFLTLEGLPGITASPDDLGGKTGGKNFFAYVWPLVFGTVWAAVIALLVAVPVAIGVALYISHYAPRRLSSTLGYVIDLLAAVPSVVYGLWGLLFLSRELAPFYQWLADNLGFIPFFAGNPSGGVSANSILTASLVLAVMILPIITAICREIFLQTPRLHEEAALALGATRWEMVRLAVFPYARSGIVSASMLGLGRALGETMAVAMVPLANQRGIPLVSPTATTHELTGKEDMFFRLVPDAATGARQQAAYVHALGARRLVTVADLKNRAFSQSWAQTAAERFIALGGVLAKAIDFEAAPGLRFADLAQRRGEAGPMPHLACFFKQPHGVAEHNLHRQWLQLVAYLERVRGSAV